MDLLTQYQSSYNIVQARVSGNFLFTIETVFNIYTQVLFNYLRAYSYSGGVINVIATLQLTGDIVNYPILITSGNTLFIGRYNGHISVYTFNGSNAFTFVTEIFNPEVSNYYCTDIDFDGTYLYVTYYQHTTGYIYAYQYNGSTLSLVDPSLYPSVQTNPIWQVYCAGGKIFLYSNNSISVYTFNGTTFTLLGSLDLSSYAYSYIGNMYWDSGNNRFYYIGYDGSQFYICYHTYNGTSFSGLIRRIVGGTNYNHYDNSMISWISNITYDSDGNILINKSNSSIDTYSPDLSTLVQNYAGGGIIQSNTFLGAVLWPVYNIVAMSSIIASVGSGMIALYGHAIDFVANHTTGIVPLTVTFTDIIRVGGTPVVKIYTWGDGSSTSPGVTTHTYTSAGTYSVNYNVVIFNGFPQPYNTLKTNYITVSNSASPTPPGPVNYTRFDNIATIKEPDGTKHFYYRDLVTNKKNFVEYFPPNIR